MFKKTKPPGLEIFNSKLASRVARIPTPEMLTWADQSLYELSRHLSAYQRTTDSAYLNEALVGAEALHALLLELNRRVVK